MKRKIVFTGMLIFMLTLSYNAVAQETPPEQWSVQDRWNNWLDGSTKVKIANKVSNDGINTITISGTAEKGRPLWDYLWKAKAQYQYTVEAGKFYTIQFEAWTKSGTRLLNVQYFGDSSTNTYLSTDWINENTPGVTIDKTRKTYTVATKQIPKSGVQTIQFHCANQTGEFYIKILAIVEGRSIPPADHLMLFDNGQWNNQLGRVTVVGQNEATKSLININATPYLRFENGFYKLSGTEGSIRVEFGNRINASRYRYLTIETEEDRKGMSYWAGGQIITYHTTAFTDPSDHWTTPKVPTNLILYGYWGVGANWTADNNAGIIRSQDGNITFDLRGSQSQDTKGVDVRNPDLTNLAGFNVKPNAAFDNNPHGSITIRRVYLHN